MRKPPLPSTVILSCPDKIGDAVVALPAAGWIKAHAPATRVIMLGRRYSEAVWRTSEHIDEVITVEDLQALGDAGAARALAATGAGAFVHLVPSRLVGRWARAAAIKIRIGTLRRVWMWPYCTAWVNVPRNAGRLHEAQLHIKLLGPLGLPGYPPTQALGPYMGLKPQPRSAQVRALMRDDRRNVVVHPLADAGPVWGLEHFADLIRLLDPDRYNVLVTGTAKDAERYRRVLPQGLPHVTDLGGQLTVASLIELLAAADAIVAASTGPLHVAAAYGVRAIGVFTMQRSRSPQRWGPIGADTRVLVNDLACPACARDEQCPCIGSIAAARVLDHLPA